MLEKSIREMNKKWREGLKRFSSDLHDEIVSYTSKDEAKTGMYMTEIDWIDANYREEQQTVQTPEQTFGIVLHTRQCKKCGSKSDVSWRAEQKRKSDEDTTFIFQCAKCNHQWKE